MVFYLMKQMVGHKNSKNVKEWVQIMGSLFSKMEIP